MNDTRGNNALNLTHTDDSVEMRVMDKPKSKLVTVSMSEAQINAMDNAAKRRDMNRSEYIRFLISQDVENFPDDLPAHGENLKSSKNTN